ncbi:MAG: hypothetical protein GEV00_24115, partial [Actinophytocola sp.]|nr:hypothetical protein [Actinophytocola sp.]
ARWALWKNPEHHTDRDRARLAYIAANHPVLHRAWALKEGLRTVFTLAGVDALDALDRWLAWASRCRIDAFIALGRRIRAHYHPIAATLNCGLSNALAESINTKIRLIARRAFGFHNIDALIALARRLIPTLSAAAPAIHRVYAHNPDSVWSVRSGARLTGVFSMLILNSRGLRTLL